MRTNLASIVGLALIAAFTSSPAWTARFDERAGYGSSDITGYEVSEIHYDLDPETGSHIAQVRFKLGPTPVHGARIRVKLNRDGVWHRCHVDEGSSVLCPISTEVSVGEATSITVSVT